MSYLETSAKPEYALDWDNCGLQFGDKNATITSILIALDVDKATLDAANKQPYDLIITHHPIFFKGIKKIQRQSDLGQILGMCYAQNTAVYTMHTNLDAAEGGVNDCLIEAYGLSPKSAKTFTSDNIGKVIKSPKITTKTLTTTFKCRQVGAPLPEKIDKLAFCGGSGKSLLNAMVHQQIPVLVTGELGYHDEVFCTLHGITALLLGHKESEDPVLPAIQKKIKNKFPKLTITLI